MEPIGAGERVKVTTGARQLDGILVDVLHGSKAVVAVMDRARGPVLRTVDREVLAERTEEGPDDRALELLIRRTPPTARRASRAGAGGPRERAGHTRAAAHRPTGR